MKPKLKKKNFSKPLIYLISPSSVDIKNFPYLLSNVLKSGMVSIFQLRLKEYKDTELIKRTVILSKICTKHRVKFILNDRADIVAKLNLDGVHLGKEDVSIKTARKMLGNKKIIGSSCYNINKLSIKSQNLGANYVAFGSFFKTVTKKNTKKIVLTSLYKVRKNIHVPIVGIGGLNKYNVQ